MNFQYIFPNGNKFFFGFITWRNMLLRYKFISYQQSVPIRVNAITCEKILKDLSFTDYVSGKSKVIVNFFVFVFEKMNSVLDLLKIRTFRNLKSTL